MHADARSLAYGLILHLSPELADEPIDQCKAEPTSSRSRHATPVVLHNELGLPRLRKSFEAHPNGSPRLIEGVLERIRDELVDDETDGNSPVQWEHQPWGDGDLYHDELAEGIDVAAKRTQIVAKFDPVVSPLK